MGRILCTKNTMVDLNDWKRRRDIIEVYGGIDCIMARCADGTVLGKYFTNRQEAKASERDSFLLPGRSNIRQLSISQEYPGFALGVTEHGDCVVWTPSRRGFIRRTFAL